MQKKTCESSEAQESQGDVIYGEQREITEGTFRNEGGVRRGRARCAGWARTRASTLELE